MRSMTYRAARLSRATSHHGGSMASDRAGAVPVSDLAAILGRMGTYGKHDLPLVRDDGGLDRGGDDRL